MKILLLGYGKMGKTLHHLAKKKGHEVIAVDNSKERKALLKNDFDVAIEFSQPNAAAENIKYCLDNGIPVVSGTTGWLAEKPALDSFCKENNGTFFYASNYSIGVNIFFKLNEWLARVMNNYHQYDVDIEEIHHTQKLDAPSGTGITLAEGIIKNLDQKSGWSEHSNDPSQINITSLREGEVPGTHSISYTSDMDKIEISHEAFTRESFALGALIVAEWVWDKKGVLDMNDFMKG